MELSKYLINITVGLVTTAIGALIGYYWKFVKLAITNIFQKAPNIAGNWIVYDNESKNNQAGNCIIKQRGSYLKFTIHLIKSRKGNPINRTFNFKGILMSNQLIMSYEEEEGKGFINGSAVFHLKGNLRTISGLVVFFDPEKHKVVALTRVLVKK